MTFGIFAVFGLLSVVAIKFFTTSRIQAKQRQVAKVESELNTIKNELKVSESNKDMASRELKQGEQRQRSLENQVKKYDQDLKQLKK